MPAYNYYNDPYVYATPQAPIGQYQQVYKPQQPQASVNNYNFIWAQGAEAAKAYPMAPSTQMVLWDPDVDVFYKKVTDAQGKPVSFTRYRYYEEPIPENQNGKSVQESGMSANVDALESEVKNLNDKVDALIAALSNQTPSKETQSIKLDRVQKKSKEVFTNAQSNV